MASTEIGIHHTPTECDVCIIGAGPGGYVAALHGAHLGLKVALVEEADLGGVCLNWGCIPTKSLLKSASLFWSSTHDALISGEKSKESAVIKSMVERSRRIVQDLSGGLKMLLEKNAINIIKGRGYLQPMDHQAEHKFCIHIKTEGGEASKSCKPFAGGALQESSSANSPKNTMLHARYVVLATGSRARNVFSPHTWGPKDAMSAQEQPKKLLIIGAGAIGIEFASFYNAIGTNVHVVEQASAVLPMEDEEISKALEVALRKKGIELSLSASVSHVTTKTSVEDMGNVDPKDPHPESTAQKQDIFEKIQDQNFKEQFKNKKNYATNTEIKQATITNKDGTSFVWEGEHILCAIGVVGNTENLGLESTKAVIAKGFVETDSKGRTAHPGLYAIGDVTGHPCLAHKASHEAITVIADIARNLLTVSCSGTYRSFSAQSAGTGYKEEVWKRSKALFSTPAQSFSPKPLIPSCVYGAPQVASVGMTEAGAKNKGHAVAIGKASFSANGAALVQGENDGFVKLVFCKRSGLLLGGHIIGPWASELIAAIGLAIHLEATDRDLQSFVFPHPTLGEIIGEAAWDASGLAIHGIGAKKTL